MMSNIVSSQFVTKRGKEVNFKNVGDFNRMFFIIYKGQLILLSSITTFLKGNSYY